MKALHMLQEQHKLPIPASLRPQRGHPILKVVPPEGVAGPRSTTYLPPMPSLPPKPKPPLEADNPEQSSRFIDMAREVEADETPGALDRAFEKVLKNQQKSCLRVPQLVAAGSQLLHKALHRD